MEFEFERESMSFICSLLYVYANILQPLSPSGALGLEDTIGRLKRCQGGKLKIIFFDTGIALKLSMNLHRSSSTLPRTILAWKTYQFTVKTKLTAQAPLRQ